jgi:hypothetical protein
MGYKRPTNVKPLSKAQKIALMKEYVEHYRRLVIADRSALNQKVPRADMTDLLDRIGETLLKESERLARTQGPVRAFLDRNALPPAMAKLLPDTFRVFCLVLNALKQWNAAEQGATDRYLLGRSARQVCREAADTCLVTGGALGRDAELHHPVRDGRPPILLSRNGHASIEGQLSSPGDDPIERTLGSLRHERHGSWKQLRRGCMALLGRPVSTVSKASSANGRAFARRAAISTNIGYAEILEWLDKKDL